jgi:tripeptidyl-peptidase-1
VLGFLNPVIYEHASSFRDIVRGDNPGCGTDGFHALAGYDAVSGVGAPRAEELLKVVMSLP